MPAVIDRNAGILISSPNAQVYYHADLPGQSLWQIRGTKRVYIYPPVAPFLTPEQIERIILPGSRSIWSTRSGTTSTPPWSI